MIQTGYPASDSLATSFCSSDDSSFRSFIAFSFVGYICGLHKILHMFFSFYCICLCSWFRTSFFYVLIFWLGQFCQFFYVCCILFVSFFNLHQKRCCLCAVLQTSWAVQVIILQKKGDFLETWYFFDSYCTNPSDGQWIPLSMRKMGLNCYHLWKGSPKRFVV